MSIRSPLRYPGGKSKALKQIAPLLPKTIKEFREPFVGGGSVYLAARDQYGDNISYWINDLNPDVMAFWLAVRDDLLVLVKEVAHVKATITDGRALYQSLKNPDHPYGDLERAVRFFVMNRITFSGVMDAGGYSGAAFKSRFTDSSIDRLAELSGWLDNTRITQGDYAPLLHEDGKNVFIFLDPPYLSASDSRLYGKRGELHTTFDHQRFADEMRQCPHRWLITYDDSPTIRELFGFANIIEWQLQYGMNNYKQDTAAKGNELFIMNY